MKPIIYLDMDGVCTDFASASIRANGRAPAEVFRLWSERFRGEYSSFKVLGLEQEAFWESVAAEGEGFWANLQAYEWFDELYSSLQKLGEVVFLTSGTYAPWSLSGKLKWLQERFGKRFQGYVFTARKQLLARAGTILIDDFERNVTAFRAHGGEAVLFPQLWNSNHGVEERLRYALGAVEELIEEMRSEQI